MPDLQHIDHVKAGQLCNLAWYIRKNESSVNPFFAMEKRRAQNIYQSTPENHSVLN